MVVVVVVVGGGAVVALVVVCNSWRVMALCGAVWWC